MLMPTLDFLEKKCITVLKERSHIKIEDNKPHMNIFCKGNDSFDETIYSDR